VEDAGSLQIYVHTKCLLVDDVYASIGSANATRRSFQVDTEAGIAFHDPATVLELRLKLWNELLGSPTPGIDTWTPADFVTKWKAAAAANKAAKPAARQGFVIPYDYPKFPGTKSSRVPDALAEAYDPGYEPPAVTV
jgi:phosphatidylserine/phosphatidylglycerophosphate/cardiolipin synthase-like enzyme